jgi:hypothetical protein
MPRPYRSIALVLFDTLRIDAFETTTRRSKKVDRAFATFANYSEYRTCSTTTVQVLNQILGDQGCPAVGAPNGLWVAAHQAGYDDVHFGSYVLSAPTFSSTIPDDTDAHALSRAADWINARPKDAPPAFVFVHLRGGHPPYRGEGATLLEEYQSQVQSSLELVADFVDGVADEWVTVLLGDHGEEFGEHEQFHHGADLYEPALRTAFLLRASGVAPGRSLAGMGCPDAVSAIAAAAAGVPPPPALGFQFASLELKRGTLGFLYDSHLRARIEANRKTIWDPELGLWEQYDLATDPGEQEDMSARRKNDLPTAAAAMARAATLCRATTPLPQPQPVVWKQWAR